MARIQNNDGSTQSLESNDPDILSLITRFVIELPAILRDSFVLDKNRWNEKFISKEELGYEIPGSGVISVRFQSNDAGKKVRIFYEK